MSIISTEFIEQSTEAEVIAFLQKADDLYHNEQDSGIPDDVYDDIRRQAQILYPANVYFNGIGSEVRGGKINLPYAMPSLNQAYIGDYANWIQSMNAANENIVITHKLDGGSDMMVFNATGNLQIAYSRGDGLQGADITRHVKQCKSVPTTIDNDGEGITVRAEHIISPENFKKLIASGIKTRNGVPYKNPRNMVAGIMNSSENDPRVYDYIDLVCYEIVGSKLSKSKQLLKLMELGFSVVKYSIAQANTLSDEVLTDLLIKARSVSKYEIDGLVLDINTPEIRNSFTSSGLANPKYAMKFKVADESNLAEAKVVGVEWNLSKHGYFKPRIQIEPTQLVGVTVKHATGFNAKFIVDNKIGPGAVIRITRSGDVIPYCLGVVTPAEPSLPTVPFVWNETGVDILMTDAGDNADVQLQRLVDFFTSLNVPRFKEGNIKSFVDLGITNPATIIDMTVEDICSVVGSKPIGSEIYAGITEKLTNIPMYALMGAGTTFGRGIGVRTMKKLWEAFKGDMSKCQDVNAIVAVEGFDDKTADKVVNGYPEFIEFYESIKHRVTIEPYTEAVVGAFTGKVIMFTGFRDASMEAQIVALGGKMGSSVSTKTTYLVSADPGSTSGKAQKARDIGVEVISIEAMKDLIKQA